MQHISRTASIWAILPYHDPVSQPGVPLRKSLACPPDRRLFVKPLKQCFVKNPRLMPMTRIALALLCGWAGHGGKLETTVGIIAKHLGRSRRQVFRYLQDAVEEGYLLLSKTKDRIGRYTGIRIRLNFKALRYEKKREEGTSAKPARNLDVTYTSDTKTNKYKSMPDDRGFQEKLTAICLRNGIAPPPNP